jgi:hypothetical protein
MVVFMEPDSPVTTVRVSRRRVNVMLESTLFLQYETETFSASRTGSPPPCFPALSRQLRSPVAKSPLEWKKPRLSQASAGVRAAASSLPERSSA